MDTPLAKDKPPTTTQNNTPQNTKGAAKSDSIVPSAMASTEEAKEEQLSSACSQKEKEDAVQSDWWRGSIECLFPDKLYDGQFQNPGTERIFDFDDVVMKAPDPIAMLKDDIVYYPPGDDRAVFGVFVPGLGQNESVSCQRSRRYAERLETGIANMNNGSFVKQNPVLSKINPYLDWLDATVHRLGMSGSPVINNCAEFLLYAMDRKQAVNISADSHGTILLGRALWDAKKGFMKRKAAGCIMPWSQQRDALEEQWKEQSHQYINVFAFGNGYRNWVEGPKYIMVNISTDPLTVKLGMTPERAQKSRRSDIQFLSFESIFEEGNFEAHNMMYTIELLRETFVRNGLVVGDFPALYKKIQQGDLKLVAAEDSKLSDYPWPKDMMEYTWVKDSSDYLPCVAQEP